MTAAPETSELALEVAGASRRLGERTVLTDVSLTVPRGALVALAGPNGAGKSSLLRAVGGRLALDRGDIRIAGMPAGAARRAARLGVVPQDVALNAQLSVRENLRLWGLLAGTSRAVLTARISEGLGWIGLEDRAGSRVDQLSGGMRRRVNLLAGLLHRPGLLLLDEPTVGVDRDARLRFYELLADLRRDGVGVLLATHELDEAGAHCDAVVVLDQGTVIASGPVTSLLAGAASSAAEVIVMTDGRHDGAVLRAAQFASTDDGTWVRAADRTLDIAALERDLTAHGVTVLEVRLRRPTLAGAVARAIARHREART